MSRLRIEGDRLAELSGRVRHVVSDLESSGTHTGEAADYVGEENLARAVRGFSDGWSRHRADTIEGVRFLADLFDAVTQTFADLDNETAAGLRGGQ